MSEDFQAEMPHPKKPMRKPSLKADRETERLSPGTFYAQQRAMVDSRKDHLARLGMDPMHVEALRMPDHAEDHLPARGDPKRKPPTNQAQEADGQ